jgi:ABC-type glycerol-3-phosphate transport system permease component
VVNLILESEMVAMYVIVLVVALSTGVCYSIAKSRGAKVSFWIFMGAFFGPFAIPFVFFSKPIKRDQGSVSKPQIL